MKKNKEVENYNQGIIERLYVYFKENNLVATRVAKEIGINQGYFAVSKKIGSGINTFVLTKLTEKYPSLDLVWLLTGKKGSSAAAVDPKIEESYLVTKLYIKRYQRLIAELNDKMAQLEAQLKQDLLD